MKNSVRLTVAISWVLGLIIFSLGVMNLVLIHPVPGIVYIILSLLFFPPMENFVRKKLGLAVAFSLLIFLALLIFWFTLGMSDLGEMYGL